MSTKQSKISKRVVQQRVFALELLDQLLLPIGGCGEKFDFGAPFWVRAPWFSQSIKQVIVRVLSKHQHILASAKNEPRRQHPPILPALEYGEILQCPGL